MAGALNHPYRANVEATWSLVLTDGHELTRDVTGFVSRDRLGDIKEEGSLTRSGSKSVVNPTINRIYTINNATASDWSDGSTTARSIRLDEFPRTFFEDLAVPKSFHDFRFSLHNSFDKSIERSSEPLGTKIIGGLRAEGTRFIETLPEGALGANAFGADKPLVINRDIWFNPDLNAAVAIEGKGPVSGNYRMQIFNLFSSPMDDSQFQIPPGYAERLFPSLHKLPPAAPCLWTGAAIVWTIVLRSGQVHG